MIKILLKILASTALFVPIAHGAGASRRAGDVVTLHLRETEVAQVIVSPRGTVLSFPAKPEKVVLGAGSGFAVEYVEADLALTPQSSKARSNLFVYLAGRRFAFDLVAGVAGKGPASSIVLVRDAVEQEVHIGQKSQ